MFTLDKSLKKKTLVILLFFSLIFALNNYTIFTSDDIAYQYVFLDHVPSPQTHRVETLADLIESINSHYNMQNGRSLSHFILQGVLIFGKPSFNILNSLAYILVGYLIICHIFRDKTKRTWKIYLLVYSFMFLFLPQFGQSVLWVSGAVNYLWMLAITLAYTLAFRKWDLGEEVNSVFAVILGVLAGAASENGGGMAIMFAGLFVIKWFIDKKKIPLASLISIIGAILGLIYQLVSPGNLIRTSDPSAYPSFISRLKLLLIISFKSLGPMLILFILAFAVSRSNKQKIKRTPFIYILSGLASSTVMVFTPNLAARSWLWAVVFIFIGLFIELLDSKYMSTKLINAACFILVIFSIINYIPAYKDIKATYQEHQLTLEMLEEQKEQGIKDVTVKKFSLPTNKYNACSQTYHLREDPDYWFNKWFAFHHGVNSVRLTNPEEAR